MSVITLPRRVEPRAPARPSRRDAPTAPTRPRDARHVATRGRWRRASTSRKSVIVLSVALVLSLGGSMVVANRQVQIHQLQSQLLQMQSTYAVRVGTLTNSAAPAQVASQAGALHLVDPVSVTQVPSTSLDAPLPLPKFLGSAPVTSRTSR